MSVTVRLPSQLRTLVGGAGEVPVEAVTVREAILAVDATYPGIAFRVLDDRGALRRFVNVFVADEDVRFLDGLDTVENIKVCVAYRHGKTQYDYMPNDAEILAQCVPIYVEFEGWNKPTSAARLYRHPHHHRFPDEYATIECHLVSRLHTQAWLLSKQQLPPPMCDG